MKQVTFGCILYFLLLPLSALADQYKLVTSTDDLVAGAKYIIARITSGSPVAVGIMEAYKNGSKCGYITIPSDDHYDDIIVTDYVVNTQHYTPAILTLGGQTDSWTFNDGTYYYTATNSSGYFKGINSITNYCYFNISFSGNDAVIKRNGSECRMVFSDNTFFCSTATSDSYHPVSLYRQITSYSRSVTANVLGSICLPKAVAADGYSGVTFYSIAGKVMEGGVPTSIVLTRETALTAGQPYLFVSSSANISLEYTGEDSSTAGNHNGLYGSLTGCSVAEGNYVIYNNNVKKCDTGCTISANKAYIVMDEVPEYNESSSSKDIMILSLSDETTGIVNHEITETVKTTETSKEPIAYSITGQRLTSKGKGIVIINGKKEIRQ